MLNVMRDNLKHLKWVLWVVAFAMVMYLGSYFFTDSSSDGTTTTGWIARVNGDAIGTNEFLRAARRQDDALRRQLGQNYEMFRKQLRIGTQVADRLVNKRIMLAEARALGLEVSKAELSEAIHQQFSDASGQFVGMDQYLAILSQNDYAGAADFESQLREELTVNKWAALMTEAAAVSDVEMERLYRSRNEKAAFDYVFVAAGAQNAPTAVNDAELEAWLRSNSDRYRRGEARKIRMLVVERQALIAKSPVTDAEIKTFYDGHATDFAQPEQRRISHILFKVEANTSEADKRSIHDLAQSVLARVKKGESLGTLARTLSQDPESAAQGGDLGWAGRGESPLQTAAFSTPPGQSTLVESPVGYHVLEVTGTREAGTVPIDEVKDTIRRNLEVQKAEQSVRTEADRIRGLIKNPADLDSVAAKEGLKVEEGVISREDAGRDIGASPEFVDAVYKTDAGEIVAPTAIARGMAIAAVVEVLPAGVRPLSEVRAQVTADLLSARNRDAAVAAGRRALAGQSLQAAAKTLKAEVKSSGDVTPGFTLTGPGRSPELEKAIFDPATAIGATGVAPAPGGAVIYAVTRHDAFDRTKFENSKKGLRDEVVERRRNDLLNSILANLRKKYSVELNNEAIERSNG